MTYLNSGAYVNGQRPKTKKALREAITNDPGSVRFDNTAPMFVSAFPNRVTDIPAHVTLSVCGPDPYRERKWYASVTRDASGKVTVK